MSVILSLETATNACSVALQVNDKCYFRHEIAPRQHATLLLSMIASLLDEANILRADIQAVAFGQGPGSFMGVRLATGVAQGLAYGLGVPVIPISTLQTLAQTVYQKNGCSDVLAGWDARMGDVYWGRYQCDSDNIMQSLQADQLAKPSEIICDDIGLEAFCAAGNAWDIYQDAFSEPLLKLLEKKICDCFPEAVAMLSIASQRLSNGDVLAPNQAVPSYLRNKVTN